MVIAGYLNIYFQNKRAAEILLSVGSDIVEKSPHSTHRKSTITKTIKENKPEKSLPTTIVVEEETTDYKVGAACSYI